jgi:hypothetical protein
VSLALSDTAPDISALLRMGQGLTGLGGVWSQERQGRHFAIFQRQLFKKQCSIPFLVCAIFLFCLLAPKYSHPLSVNAPCPWLYAVRLLYWLKIRPKQNSTTRTTQGAGIGKLSKLPRGCSAAETRLKGSTKLWKRRYRAQNRRTSFPTLRETASGSSLSKHELNSQQNSWTNEHYRLRCRASG